jgi:DNA-binding NarL/FixJ family response regulator
MYQDGCSEQMIAKELGMDRRTVRAYIGAREAEAA